MKNMKKINRRAVIKVTALGLGDLSLVSKTTVGQTPANPFATEFPNLESLTTGK